MPKEAVARGRREAYGKAPAIFKRGDALTPRQYLDKLVWKSMVVLDDILENGEPREQVDATRVITQTWAKVREFEHQLELPKEEQIRRALRDPDDELLKALRAEREKVLALLGPEVATTSHAVPETDRYQAKKDVNEP